MPVKPDGLFEISKQHRLGKEAIGWRPQNFSGRYVTLPNVFCHDVANSVAASKKLAWRLQDGVHRTTMEWCWASSVQEYRFILLLV